MGLEEKEHINLLIRGLSLMDIEPVNSILNGFEYYLTELKRWNRTYNITGIKDDLEIIRKHFLDSLLYLEFIKDSDEVMDVGTGGGFPGVVIKLVRPSLKMILVEPSRKKVAFLKHITYELKLRDITIYQKRVEELKDIKVDVVVSRALFNLKDMIKKACRVLKNGGIIVMNKGPEFLEELRVIKMDPFFDIKVFERILPTTDIKRYMVVLKWEDGI